MPNEIVITLASDVYQCDFRRHIDRGQRFYIEVGDESGLWGEGYGATAPAALKRARTDLQQQRQEAENKCQDGSSSSP